MNFTILRFDELASTNTEAANQARRGAGEGLCVVASMQTGGRGRHGRTWISERGAGLYASVVLRPKIEMKFLPLVTLMSAIAVYETLRKFGLQPDIKWANDVLIGDRKICGILAETVETDSGLAVVVGVGVNLKSSHLPADLRRIATSIEAETNDAPDAEIVLQTLTGFLSVYRELFYGAAGARKIREEWTRRSSYAAGKRVRVFLAADEAVDGTTRGIEADGALRLETDAGEMKIVRAGAVERLRKQ